MQNSVYPASVHHSRPHDKIGRNRDHVGENQKTAFFIVFCFEPYNQKEIERQHKTYFMTHESEETGDETRRIHRFSSVVKKIYKEKGTDLHEKYKEGESCCCLIVDKTIMYGVNGIEHGCNQREFAVVK